MTNLRILRAFLTKAATDARLAPCHISLYLGIFQQWTSQQFPNVMPILKDELMKLSKLNSSATYYKVIRDLHEFGYIDYHPGCANEKSKVLLKRDIFKIICLVGLKLKFAA